MSFLPWSWDLVLTRDFEHLLSCSVGRQTNSCILPKCSHIIKAITRRSMKLYVYFILCKNYLLWCFCVLFIYLFVCFQFENIQRSVHTPLHCFQVCRSEIVFVDWHWFFKSTHSKRKLILTSNLKSFLLWHSIIFLLIILSSFLHNNLVLGALFLHRLIPLVQLNI